jgi:hypothetical protein
MDRGRFLEGGQPEREFHREAIAKEGPELRGLPGSSRPVRDLPVDVRALRVLHDLLTVRQRDRLSRLLEEVGQLRSYDALSDSYQAWWRQLEGLVRQVNGR